MTYSDLQKKYNDILEAIIHNRLLDAIHSIKEMSEQISSSDIQTRYQSILDTYRNMLKYSFELAPDPERTKIHNKLQQSILELSDDIRDNWISKLNLFERSANLQKVSYFEASYLTDIPGTILKLTKEADNNIQEAGQNDDHTGDNQEEIVNLMFYWLWLRNRYTDETRAFIIQVMDTDDVDWSIKALMVSALTLSQLRHFDREKFFLLYNLTQFKDPEIRQRAIVGLFISILVFQQRIILYQDIVDRLKSIPDDQKMQERMLAILIQYIRASETEKITKKIQQEIVPEVLKIKSELEEKLNLDELLAKEKFDEKNPEWKNFFQDAPDVYQKLEQFSKMQIEGADVFMGAFALLKHFDFFREIPNWFIPFKAGNHSINKAVQGSEGNTDFPALFGGLEKSTVLCNSDKYSFCLNLQQMPSQQRNMMLDLFNLEIKTMNEAMEDEFKIDPESKNKIVNTQYLQDLYRFFKLHPVRKEYDSIFEFEIDVLNSEPFRIIYSDQKLIKNLAEFYFAKDRYFEALRLFVWLNDREKSFEYLEKMGYCYQKIGKFHKAIELYQQAELFDKNKIWLQKKLGYCYRKTGDYSKAIEYYKNIIKSEPTDLNNLAYLGQLYIDIEDYESALKYYYKVEYEQSDNMKVYRPIGWCSFVQGKYDIAIKYFSKILEKNPAKSDYLNIGHSYWASGRLDRALEAYREAVRISGNDRVWFREMFFNDSKYLKKTGITDLDTSLMVDYVLLFTQGI